MFELAAIIICAAALGWVPGVLGGVRGGNPLAEAGAGAGCCLPPPAERSAGGGFLFLPGASPMVWELAAARVLGAVSSLLLGLGVDLGSFRGGGFVPSRG